ncbi:MAG: SDR family NAD(P)-dependent oxidoreductase [Piscinibacter sp.]|nr:SDR family NAD(P)-dependent oxidoreductase [Piscinibacter sp.]
MTADFSGRCAILTGAAGNLGRAVAAAFAARGASLVLVDRDAQALRAAFGDDSAQRLCIAADLLDPAQAQAALDAAVGRLGSVDILCNLAGGFRMGEAVHETSAATWELLWGLNVRTLLHMAQAAVPHLIAHGGGRIVNVGAFAAQRGVAAMGAYCAAKDSVIRLTEAMSAELKGHGINVNCVLPTIIDTPENRAAMPDADPSRWVAPADLASAIVFLASDEARAIHGAALPVSGLG